MSDERNSGAPRVTDSPRVRMGMPARRAIANLQRGRLRLSMLRSRTDDPPARPVFVIGCPRSGTSLLFELLRRHPALASLRGEGHVLWSTYQHPRFKGWASDRAVAGDIRPGERQFLYSAIARIAGPRRFLDKTPKNVMRLPYLGELFPDATFVLLSRDGRAVVSSLIEGWEVRQSPVYRLPQRLDLEEYRGRLWSFVLPPRWRAWASTSLRQVAALQFASSYDLMLADRSGVDADRIVELRFEDLVARPLVEVGRVLERLELPFSDEVRDMASNLEANVVQSNSPPRPDKWRERAAEILSVRSQIEPTMLRLGYEFAGSESLG
jgi:hypothetical protein